MKIRQISLFLENKPGQLSAPMRTLATADINIMTLCLADSRQFGILRLIVKDWEKAKTALEAAGFAVNITEVLAIDIEDRPGSLAAILAVCEAENLGIEYMYAFAQGPGAKKAALIFRFADPDRAMKILDQNKFNVVKTVELLGK
jgi:hypothetical protein